MVICQRGGSVNGGNPKWMVYKGKWRFIGNSINMLGNSTRENRDDSNIQKMKTGASNMGIYRKIYMD